LISITLAELRGQAFLQKSSFWQKVHILIHPVLST